MILALQNNNSPLKQTTVNRIQLQKDQTLATSVHDILDMQITPMQSNVNETLHWQDLMINTERGSLNLLLYFQEKGPVFLPQSIQVAQPLPCK